MHYFILSIMMIASIRLNAFTYVDFDASMQQELYAPLLKRRHQSYLYRFFKHLYNYHAAHTYAGKQLLIPKIMHHICLGRPAWPAEYQAYLASCISYHPAYMHIVWYTDEGARFIHDHFPALESFYNQLTNWGARADVLRYAALYYYGGVYFDWDQQALASLDELHYMYHFYIGIQPLDTTTVQLGIGLIGSCPYHPLLKACLDQLPVQKSPHVVAKTGPLYFTTIFVRHAQQHGLNDIALPASYFYPCSYEQRGKPAQHWHKPESLAVHHWAGSWLQPAGSIKK